jgi:fumarate reductase subunit C
MRLEGDEGKKMQISNEKWKKASLNKGFFFRERSGVSTIYEHELLYWYWRYLGKKTRELSSHLQILKNGFFWVLSKHFLFSSLSCPRTFFLKKKKKGVV